jgi:S-DNA-T family DNA segregation ATPase FtsK/SpoIIIE
MLSLIGLWLTDNARIKMWSLWKYALMSLVWVPLFFGFLSDPDTGLSSCAIFGGAVGRWLNAILHNYTGWIGVLLILIFLFLVFAVYQFNMTFNHIKQMREKRIEEQRREAALIAEQRIKDEIEKQRNNETDNGEDIDPDFIDDDIEDDDNLPPVTSHTYNQPIENDNNDEGKENVFIQPADNSDNEVIETTENSITTDNNEVDLVIEKTEEEETVDTIERHTIDTPYDPHYELRGYKFPTLDMLNDYGDKKSEINEAELQANKNKIVETLGNYGIAIEKIKATIGPTVTLYEIVPAAGIRISKIKNLEDDIALSLAALGIRIIAPIPGKGTIGIEVPNSKPETVSMKSVLASEKFQNNKYALPCAIGKTISNETYVFDLAKMPHILMAGATGQGKSVGLNAIIASLLYSKHPSELKFVMVDPKKVELTLYNRIERHYLAKLPDSEDAIITDVKQVVRTLNSLCIEMDQRYDLLKAAECRNIIEYNEKFKARRLLPTEGHRFLPYIVLVVDEFADLIMTAGREVESPIARLAQLARAIGIHLIIATQRPSVNIITGSIKANFPARIAFRVISQVDSKTILDQSGANQLIGRGDMLLSTGNDLVRLQCAFIDTPEVESVTEYIGAQRGYAEPFLLPEVPEEDGEGVDIDDEGERDSLFEEAARIVVQTQQGSTSMIQRKLKLGYNRAGRIIDQLEAAGIVGPFSGSKSREVKVGTEAALEQILQDIYNKDNGI